ncbi:LysR family transcriptional regulator [Sphingobium sp. C100]|uniref:LysR family transcriptional regulator n=1 Tax=Sphingobium sp. C100 TaxID=1207055 RepID=UPI0003D656D8|nr:LysR family transcriptional regulator [Sphingobium sp. C100]ETI63470.1 LysR family transcriptional regulator [Sphingobium sp. C100]
MASDNLRELSAFIAVAEERSFTRAAARLGVSQSALSQTIRTFEERLGIRLLTRTTRSVSATEAGERLLGFAAPAILEIETGLAQLGELRDKPAGTIRLTADEYAVRSIIWPALEKFLRDYPDISVEVATDYGLIDIVSDRYDAGVRRGGLIAKDMIAVRIGPDVQMAVVGAPAYFERHSAPTSPRDLTDHDCINLRLPTHGALFHWPFEKSGQQQQIKVAGSLVFSSLAPMLDAALAGFGLAYIPAEWARPHLDAGRLVEVLETWRHTFEGYHLYYPSRRQQPPALAALIDALRFGG